MFKTSKLLAAISAVLFVLLMVLQPRVVFEGASIGLKAWWNIVVPSLLPFFIASELLMSFGIVNFMGVLLEPIMRPLFNVPGSGAFVMVVGYTSGCPLAAVVTAKLRQAHQCSQVEAERLLCFTNNSSPLFMLVAVSVGMFNNSKLGIIIVCAHYFANITIGLLLKYYHRKEDLTYAPASSPNHLIRHAIAELSLIQQRENRPFGKILGEAISTSMNTLLKIGGFIIFFAVIIRLLTALGIIAFVASKLAFLFLPIGLDPAIFNAISSGLFEMTLGTKIASETSAPLLHQLIAVAFILGWSGFSIHAQVISMIADTDIRIFPYICSRFMQATLASIYTYFIWLFIDPIAKGWLGAPVLSTHSGYLISCWQMALVNFKYFLFILMLIILLAFLYQIFISLKNLKRLIK